MNYNKIGNEGLQHLTDALEYNQVRQECLVSVIELSFFPLPDTNDIRTRGE